MSYLFLHLQPIYVSSFFFLEYDNSFINIFAEGIPLLKGILETGSVYSAEIFSKYDAGVDLDFGSNNSMYMFVKWKESYLRHNIRPH